MLLFLREPILGAPNVLPEADAVIVPQDGQDRFAADPVDLTPSIDLELPEDPITDSFPDGDFSPTSEDSPTSLGIDPTEGLPPVMQTTSAVRSPRLATRDLDICASAPCLCNICLCCPWCCDIPTTEALVVIGVIIVATVSWFTIRFRRGRQRKLK